MTFESGTSPSFETLRRLRTLSQFESDQLMALSNALVIETAPAGTALIPRGCTEDFSFYLLEGSLTAEAADGKVRTIESQPFGDLEPVAQLRPSMLEVIARTRVSYLKIYRVQLTEFAQAMMQSSNDGESVDVFEFEGSLEDHELTFKIYENIVEGRLELPSLPDVAVRIQQAFESDAVDADKVSRIIQTDPAMTAKLIMVANSPLYRGASSIETVNAAVVRLGLQSARKLVLTYAVNELFDARSGVMKKRMRNLWNHSRRVAALSRVLAAHTGQFDREEAQLAGLLHQLGTVAILHYLQENPNLCKDEESLDQSVRSLSGFITSLVLKKWHFGNEMVTVAEECGDWFRNHDADADLCDLVLIALIHSYIGTREMSRVPPLSKVPALSKLSLGQLGPNDSLKILEESKDDIKAVEALLGGGV